MEEEYGTRSWHDEDAGSDTEDHRSNYESTDEIIKDCMEKFALPDYIMEPSIFNTLKRYFSVDGEPETVIDLLCNNYKAISGLSNLIAEWLILSGVEIIDVQSLVEKHLTSVILRTFDPSRADSIFNEEEDEHGQAAPAWLSDIIKHSTWRSLVYTLAQKYPDCMMLNFTIKLISDAGFQAEITSLATAAQQIEVFSRIVRTSLLSILSQDTTQHFPDDEPSSTQQNSQRLNGVFLQSTSLSSSLSKLCHTVVRAQHTYIYTMCVLHVLEKRGIQASSPMTPNLRRVSQELSMAAVKDRGTLGHNVTAVQLALKDLSRVPRSVTALSSMLAKRQLNPADIIHLHRQYTSDDPPSIDFIRFPAFLHMLIDILFRPGKRINQEHKCKYIYLLAYAVSVYETVEDGDQRTPETAYGVNGDKSLKVTLHKDELDMTVEALFTVSTVCQTSKASVELLPELNTLYRYIQLPVVAIGVLEWVKCVVSDPSFFKLCTESTPLHLALLDEIVRHHPLLHSNIMELYITLFESDLQTELEIMVQLQIRRMLLDRIICLLCEGYVMPVLAYLERCWRNSTTDVSLIRYFVLETLSVIGPPYSKELVRRLLPVVQDKEVMGVELVGGAGVHDLVAAFIQYCEDAT